MVRPDQEIENLKDLARDVVERARKGGADVAEAIARSGGGFAMWLSGGFGGGSGASYASLVVSRLAADGENKNRRGFHYSAKRFLADLDSPEAVGKEAARRTLRKLGARKVPTCDA